MPNATRRYDESYVEFATHTRVALRYEVECELARFLRIIAELQSFNHFYEKHSVYHCHYSGYRLAVRCICLQRQRADSYSDRIGDYFPPDWCDPQILIHIRSSVYPR